MSQPINEWLQERVGQPWTQEDADRVREHLRKVDELAMYIMRNRSEHVILRFDEAGGAA